MLGISEKMDQFKNYLFESFEDGCALKGMVIGVVVGTLATLIIITMVYVLSRYCRKCVRYCCKKRSNNSGVKLNRSGQTSSTKTPEPYVIIDIYGFDPVPVDTTEVTQRAKSKECVIVEVDNAAYSPADNDVVKEDAPEAEGESHDDGETAQREQHEVTVEPETINSEDEPRSI
ncbi:uncharacterized protein LOC114518151 [Dendronephthya gigantea]|uniref:uncharacterized protein LOC114518151 n=1 Tax=Dendronephthya gigantea TaxID=151771 RepID=UPI00106B6ECE|nr:uncharacterized protein LOC114518151 [Dendronephthya gigantea]